MSDATEYTLKGQKHRGDPVCVVSSRAGQHWMDGHAILGQRESIYMRPWDGFIPEQELSVDNLPPFYVRLQDVQVGPLHKWAHAAKGKFPSGCLHDYWPHDFLRNGSIATTRQCWGVPCAVPGSSSETRYDRLVGGEHPPAYTDPGLPLTYTSSGKIMLKEPIAPGSDLSKKRSATEERGEDADRAGKRACPGSNLSETVKEELNDAFEGATNSRDVVLQTLVAKIDSMDGERVKMEERMRQFESQKRVDTETIGAQEKDICNKEESLKNFRVRLSRETRRFTKLQEQLQLAEQTIKTRDDNVAYLEKEHERG